MIPRNSHLFPQHPETQEYSYSPPPALVPLYLLTCQQSPQLLPHIDLTPPPRTTTAQILGTTFYEVLGGGHGAPTEEESITTTYKIIIIIIIISKKGVEERIIPLSLLQFSLPLMSDEYDSMQILCRKWQPFGEL